MPDQLAILRAQRDAATDPMVRTALDAAIAALEAQQATEHIQTGDISDAKGIAIGPHARSHVETSDQRSGSAFVDKVDSLHQHFYQNSATHQSLRPAYTAAEVSELQRQAQLAFYRKHWIEAADILARLVERAPDDSVAVRQLAEARKNLRLHSRYEVAKQLQQAGEWQAVLSALDDIMADFPEFSDPDSLREWAESEHVRAVFEPHFGSVYKLVTQEWFRDAIQQLTRELDSRPDDVSAKQALVHLIEDAMIPIPARLRVQCGNLLNHHLNDGFSYSLPSELEWEYAARRTERSMYPWGDETPNTERANFENAYQRTTPVGCFPAGATADGLLDLAGNVWEWTCSAYKTYPYEPVDGREYISQPDQKRFTLRGGSWYDLSIRLTAAHRVRESPGNRSLHVGFRVARHPTNSR